jgi:opine dehydrogenase
MTKSRQLKSYTVIGAGHGGQALAAYLAYLGNPTTLYNRTKMVIDQINAYGGIEVQGMINTMVNNITATANIKKALEDSEIIMVCIPAHAHQDIASLMAPHINENHKIVINPGRTLGAFMFSSYLKEAGCDLDIPIGETDTFVLTSRKVRPGISQIFSRKRLLKVAALTKAHSQTIHKALVDSFSMVVATDSVLETSLSNIGMIFHPVPALMNIGRIECGEHYLHYKEGITPMIAKFLEKLDAERIALAKFFGLNLPSAHAWLGEVYGSEGINLYQALQNTHQYNEIGSPEDITTRYIYEDIPTGIVPILQLAKLANTPHTTLQLVLDLANRLYGIDFNAIGRNDVQAFFDLYKPKA